MLRGSEAMVTQAGQWLGEWQALQPMSRGERVTTRRSVRAANKQLMWILDDIGDMFLCLFEAMSSQSSCSDACQEWGGEGK